MIQYIRTQYNIQPKKIHSDGDRNLDSNEICFNKGIIHEESPPS
jgi:hypothetical protein